MSDSSSTKEEGGASGGRRSHWLPILLSVLLLAACLWCMWLLWEQWAAARSERLAAEARLESLLGQKNELEALLKLPPCEAAAKLAPPPQAAQPPAAPAAPAEPKVDDGQKAKPEASAKPKAPSPAALDPDAVEAACVFLVSLSGGSQLGTGSGFFIAPGYIATNRHVVGRNPGKILVTSKALGRPVGGRVVASGKSKDEDFAIVEVELPPGAKVAPLQFADGVKKTQKVGAWGFPNIIGKNDPAYARLLRGEDINAVPELSYSEGVVSAILDRSPKVVVHTAPISPGNSGGPLLNEDGQVVGINTMITLDEDSYRQASLALSAEDLLRFVRGLGLPLP